MSTERDESSLNPPKRAKPVDNHAYGAPAAEPWRPRYLDVEELPRDACDTFFPTALNRTSMIAALQHQSTAVRACASLGYVYRLPFSALGENAAQLVRWLCEAMSFENGMCAVDVTHDGDGHTFISVPAALGRALWGVPDVCTRTDGLPLREGQFLMNLYASSTGESTPPQRELCEATLRAVDEVGFTCMEAPTGSGKTLMMAWMMWRLGRRTIVVTKRRQLLQQMMNKTLSRALPHLRVAIMRGKRVTKTVKEADVVFITTKSFGMAGHDTGFWDTFGLMLVDEAHMLGFREMLDGCRRTARPRNIIGVSATMRRSDDRFPLVLSMFGAVHTRLGRLWDAVDVLQITLRYPVYGPEATFPVKLNTYGPEKGRPNFNAFLKDIASHPQRRAAVLRQLAELTTSRRQILAFGKETAALELLRDEWRESAPAGERDAGLLYEETNKGEAFLRETRHQLIFTTYDSGSVGLDLDDVDTVVLIQPISKCSIGSPQNENVTN